MDGQLMLSLTFSEGFVSITPNVLRLGGRFNAAKPLLWAVAVY